MSVASAPQSLMDIHPRELEQFAGDLPTLPAVFQELFARMQDPDAQVSELAELIGRDQALTARILKLVNSAFYGSPSQVSTIARAVVIMGFQAVRSAALAVSVFQRFQGMDAAASAVELGEVWRHSIAVSCLAKQLSIVLHRCEPEDAYVAGLLHDTGKLVMMQHFPEDVAELRRTAREQQLSWREGEELLFPIDHASIGQALFRAWDFPADVVEAVAYHHRPEKASRHAELAALVHLADYLATHLGAACPGAVPSRVHSQDAAGLLGLTPDAASQVMEGANEEFAESLGILKLLY